MSDAMTYQGYSARIQFDAGDRIFFGQLAGVADGVGFHADTVDALEAAFHEAVDDYLATCETLGRKPDKPYSGKVMLRVSPELHARIAMKAQLTGRSINQLGEEALQRALG